MARKKASLRVRIFFSMILLVVMTSLLILGATFYQYYSQSDDYNIRRLERKETQMKNHLNYVLEGKDISNYFENRDEDLYDVFFSIALIHKVEYGLFTNEGIPLFYSYVQRDSIENSQNLASKTIEDLFLSDRKRIVIRNKEEQGRFQSSYSVLYNNENKAYAILYFPYFEDVSFSSTELNTFLIRLFQIYSFMLLVAIAIAYFISSYMTRALEVIRARIDRTGLLKGNEKIYISNASKEIESLVNSYNSMLDALEESVAKLTKSEREQAWQEMAKQVAHEIKNPLTPMRLSVQVFQQRFDSNDPDINKKVINFSRIMIEQIDTMSKVANAFSDFATFPKLRIETSDIVEITKLSLEIFDRKIIRFQSSSEKILWKIDRTQWVRIITNLLKNAIQAIPSERTTDIQIYIKEEGLTLRVEVKDNGTGISKENENKVFEPNFTTKTAGMGMGLAIVKNSVDSLGGIIYYKTEKDKGTSFIIELNKEHSNK